jgi:hypothetical protein
VEKLQAAAEDATSPLAREGALLAVAALAADGLKFVEPHLVLTFIPIILDRLADKVRRGLLVSVHLSMSSPVVLGLACAFLFQDCILAIYLWLCRIHQCATCDNEP